MTIREKITAWIWTVVIGVLSLGAAAAIVWLLCRAARGLQIWQ